MIVNPVVQSGGTGFNSYVNCYWSTEGVDLKDEDGNVIPKELG